MPRRTKGALWSVSFSRKIHLLFSWWVGHPLRLCLSVPLCEFAHPPPHRFFFSNGDPPCAAAAAPAAAFFFRIIDSCTIISTWFVVQ